MCWNVGNGMLLENGVITAKYVRSTQRNWEKRKKKSKDKVEEVNVPKEPYIVIKPKTENEEDVGADIKYQAIMGCDVRTVPWHWIVMVLSTHSVPVIVVRWILGTM